MQRNPFLLAALLIAGCSAREGGEPEPPPDGHQLGNGNAVLVEIYRAQDGREATDLAFNRARPEELWVTLREPYEGLPCTEEIKTGCAALEGHIAIITGADGAAPSAVVMTDPNSWHFLRRPTSIAFGAGDTFATCGEYRTGNWDDSSVDYMGPTLWTSDPAIFALEQPPPADGSFEPNGSHLDMLHETPFCMGIAHDSGNAYFTFNGTLGSIDRYDFREPHPPGGDDHSDGELRRYVEGELARVENVPGHLAYDAASAKLYIADTGNGRVLALDAKSGTPAEDIATNEIIASAKRVTGATLTEVIAQGLVGVPSGLAFAGGALFVTDRATGMIHAFDRNGTLLRTLDSGLGPGTIAGITIGPDDRAYVIDQFGGRVLRVDVP